MSTRQLWWVVAINWQDATVQVGSNPAKRSSATPWEPRADFESADPGWPLSCGQGVYRRTPPPATAGYRQCHECSWFDGNHAPHCRTRGYQHPSGTCRECGGIEGRHSWLCPVKPPPSAPATAKCECGVDAAGQGGLHSSWCPRRT